MCVDDRRSFLASGNQKRRIPQRSFQCRPHWKLCCGITWRSIGAQTHQNQDLQFTFHIERKPEGGFVIHSSDPNAEPTEVLTHNDMESHFAAKIIGFVGKHLTPE
jgi:hypothetical protein